jgi:hypothetical protein
VAVEQIDQLPTQVWFCSMDLSPCSIAACHAESPSASA